MDTARPQTAPEEWANSFSHALGVVLALAAWPLLSDVAAQHSGPRGAAGVTVFIATMVLQFAVSAAYHAWPAGRAKLWWRSLDHAVIYVFIAGSSTPFTLGLIGGGAGSATCAVIWTLALAGAWLKLCRRLTDARLSTGLYILFGWIVLMLVWRGLPPQADGGPTLWLVGGALAYLVGAVFYMLESLRFSHFVWHLFVLAGSGCHLCAALWPALQ
jgi:hemolysin III